VKVQFLHEAGRVSFQGLEVVIAIRVGTFQKVPKGLLGCVGMIDRGASHGGYNDIQRAPARKHGL